MTCATSPRLATALLAWACASTALAELRVVGPADGFAPIEAAKAGDIVELLPGVYRFRVHLSELGTSAAPIVIRAADPAQPPVFDLEGQPTEAWPGSWAGTDSGRGCWRVSGDHYVVSGLAIRGCRTTDGFGAGLRATGAGRLSLRDIRVSDSDKGLYVDAERALVEFCELERNGHALGPSAHLFQTGGDLTVRFCHFHDAFQSQDFHVAGRSVVLEYNVFSMAEDYCGSISSNGVEPAPTVLLRGNLFSLHPTPINGAQVFALYESLGPGGAALSVTLVWNTFVVRTDRSPALLHVLNQDFRTVTATVANNVIAGTDTLTAIARPARGNFQLSGRRNWIEPTAIADGLTDSVGGGAPGFVVDGGALATGFELEDTSACAGAADVSAPAPPAFQLALGADGAPRARRRPSVTDVGAFERAATGSLLGPSDDIDFGETDAGIRGADGGADAGSDGQGPLGDGGLGDAGGSPSPTSLRLGCDCAGTLGGAPGLALAVLGVLGGLQRRRARRR